MKQAKKMVIDYHQYFHHLFFVAVNTVVGVA